MARDVVEHWLGYSGVPNNINATLIVMALQSTEN